MEKPTILCVDDEPGILSNLEDQIGKDLGDTYEIELAESGEEGLEIVEELMDNNRHLAVVICDQLMPKMKGEDFLIEVHKRLPQTLKIMLTGQASLESVGRTINHARLFRYITKPWSKGELMEVVHEAAGVYNQYLQLVEYTELLQSLSHATQEMSGERRSSSIIHKFVNSALQNFGAERGYLLLQSGGESTPIDFTHTPDNFDFNFREKDSKSLLKFNRDKNLQVTDYNEDLEERIHKTSAEEHPEGHELATELSYKGRKLGYVYLENSLSQQNFTDNQKAVLEMLASQTAISLENAQLYETLEQKNQDITDSINYARRLLEAIMPAEHTINRYFPKAFILDIPKDIISGDFPWISEMEGKVLVGAVDSTGHGVPGALMALIGYNFLNQIINIHREADPAVILDYLHEQVRNTLNLREDEDLPKDGMDLVLTAYNPQTRQLEVAGAHRPLWLLRGGEVQTYATNRFSIGEIKVPEELREFKLQTIQLEPGDQVYLFSDGIIDQFGGPDNKRFSKRRFRELLLSVADKPPKERREAIQQAFDDWRNQGEIDPTDDVLIVSFEVS